MSRLDELIQQYCPDGVAYVALETVCLISKGIQFNKKICTMKEHILLLTEV